MKQALIVGLAGFPYDGADWKRSKDLLIVLLGAMQKQGVSSSCSIFTSSLKRIGEFVPGAIERNKVEMAFLIFENTRERTLNLLETSQQLLDLLPDTIRLIVLYINGEGAVQPEERSVQQLREAGCKIINGDRLLSGEQLLF